VVILILKNGILKFFFLFLKKRILHSFIENLSNYVNHVFKKKKISDFHYFRPKKSLEIGSSALVIKHGADGPITSTNQGHGTETFRSSVQRVFIDLEP